MSQYNAEWLKSQASSNPVFIITRTGCPYCECTVDLAHNIFKKKVNTEGSAQVHEFSPGEKDAFKKVMIAESGHSSFPSVYIGGKHIGGNSDFVKGLTSGELYPELNDLGVEINELSKDQVNSIVRRHV